MAHASIRRIALVLALAAMAQACGTKGALYLPKPDAEERQERRRQ